MAQAILRPSVVDFIKIATAGHNLELQLKEIRISATSSLVTKTLIASGIRKDLSLIIVGIKSPAGSMNFNPAPETIVNSGNVMIALGEQAAITNLENMA